MYLSSTTPRDGGLNAGTVQRWSPLKWSSWLLILFASLVLAGPAMAYAVPEPMEDAVVLPAANAIGAPVHLAQAQPASPPLAAPPPASSTAPASPAASAQPAASGEPIGNVATLTGMASVARN